MSRQSSPDVGNSTRASSIPLRYNQGSRERGRHKLIESAAPRNGRRASRLPGCAVPAKRAAVQGAPGQGAPPEHGPMVCSKPGAASCEGCTVPTRVGSPPQSAASNQNSVGSPTRQHGFDSPHASGHSSPSANEARSLRNTPAATTPGFGQRAEDHSRLAAHHLACAFGSVASDAGLPLGDLGVVSAADGTDAADAPSCSGAGLPPVHSLELNLMSESFQCEGVAGSWNELSGDCGGSGMYAECDTNKPPSLGEGTGDIEISGDVKVFATEAATPVTVSPLLAPAAAANQMNSSCSPCGSVGVPHLGRTPSAPDSLLSGGNWLELSDLLSNPSLAFSSSGSSKEAAGYSESSCGPRVNTNSVSPVTVVAELGPVSPMGSVDCSGPCFSAALGQRPVDSEPGHRTPELAPRAEVQPSQISPCEQARRLVELPGGAPGDENAPPANRKGHSATAQQPAHQSSSGPVATTNAAVTGHRTQVAKIRSFFEEGASTLDRGRVSVGSDSGSGAQGHHGGACRSGRANSRALQQYLGVATRRMHREVARQRNMFLSIADSEEAQALLKSSGSESEDASAEPPRDADDEEVNWFQASEYDMKARRKMMRMCMRFLRQSAVRPTCPQCAAPLSCTRCTTTDEAPLVPAVTMDTSAGAPGPALELKSSVAVPAVEITPAPMPTLAGSPVAGAARRVVAGGDGPQGMRVVLSGEQPQGPEDEPAGEPEVELVVAAV